MYTVDKNKCYYPQHNNSVFNGYVLNEDVPKDVVKEIQYDDKHYTYVNNNVKTKFNIIRFMTSDSQDYVWIVLNEYYNDIKSKLK